MARPPLSSFVGKTAQQEQKPSLNSFITPQQQAPQQQSWFDKNVGGFAEGMGMGVLRTLKGASDIGQNVARTITKPFIGQAADKTFLDNQFDTGVKQLTTPKTTPQKVGYTTETIAEYFIPASRAAQAERAVDLMTKGLPALSGAATRIAGKSAIQGIASGLVSFVQSGGDLKETKRTAVTAGLTRGAFATIGEGARALKLPERIYSTIFKNSRQDMLKELNADGLEALRKSNPARYNELVAKGIIRTTFPKDVADAAGTIDRHYASTKQILDNLGPDDIQKLGGTTELVNRLKTNIVDGLTQEGRNKAAQEIAALNTATFSSVDDFVGAAKSAIGAKPYINNTLAEQALDKGLRGSIRSMSDEVVHKTLDIEDKVQRIAHDYTGTVKFPEKQYVNVLKGIAQEYDDVGFGEISDEATKLANTLTNKGGNLSGEEAIALRRFLDRMRIASSFDKPASKLSLTQSNFKTLADTARARVNEIPGMGDTMKDYGFYIDALETLAREAARRGNNQVIGLIDSIFLGGAIVSPVPGLTMGALRRLLLSPSGATALGQQLYNGSFSAFQSGALGGLSNVLQSSLPNQESQSPQTQKSVMPTSGNSTIDQSPVNTRSVGPISINEDGSFKLTRGPISGEPTNKDFGIPTVGLTASARSSFGAADRLKDYLIHELQQTPSKLSNALNSSLADEAADFVKYLKAVKDPSIATMNRGLEILRLQGKDVKPIIDEILQSIEQEYKQLRDKIGRFTNQKAPVPTSPKQTTELDALKSQIRQAVSEDQFIKQRLKEYSYSEKTLRDLYKKYKPQKPIDK